MNEWIMFYVRYRFNLKFLILIDALQIFLAGDDDCDYLTDTDSWFVRPIAKKLIVLYHTAVLRSQGVRMRPKNLESELSWTELNGIQRRRLTHQEWWNSCQFCASCRKCSLVVDSQTPTSSENMLPVQVIVRSLSSDGERPVNTLELLPVRRVTSSAHKYSRSTCPVILFLSNNPCKSVQD